MVFEVKTVLCDYKSRKETFLIFWATNLESSATRHKVSQ